MDVTLGRTVTALVTYADEDLGQVGPFDIVSPWWADVEPVVAHVRAELGVNVVVVRLVDVDGGTPPRNGHVTYHVEALHRPTPTTPGNGPLSSSGPIPDALRTSASHRAVWATPAGIRDALTWAAPHLAVANPTNVNPATVNPADTRPTAVNPTDTDSVAIDLAVDQVKTWNLSALFRIRTDRDPVWLKLTPPFAAHEADVIALIATVDGSLVPMVLASDPGHRRTLMAHVPGADCWHPSPQLIGATVTRWVAAQAALGHRGVPLGTVPDRRPRTLVEGLRRLLDGDAGSQLGSNEMARARALLDRLPQLIAELDACGLPDTLVHGDFHPGNWRSDGRNTVLVDFADAYYGHPAFDGERLRDVVDAERQPVVVDAWCDAWIRHVPASDPRRALELAGPLQAIAGAILYQTFLDNVEDSERRYHEDDPAAGIRTALGAFLG